MGHQLFLAQNFFTWHNFIAKNKHQYLNSYILHAVCQDDYMPLKKVLVVSLLIRKSF